MYSCYVDVVEIAVGGVTTMFDDNPELMVHDIVREYGPNVLDFPSAVTII